MSIAEHIKSSLDLPTFAMKAYLEDLTDEDLMKRPAETANHIAWQLGHLVVSENQIIEMVFPNTMPALPEGFAEKYTKETASIDDPAAFHSKEEYLKLFDEQRAGTLAVLATLSDEDMSKPTPEPIQKFASNVGCLFSGQGAHRLMHAGQWIISRRQLGKGPMF